MTGMSIFKSVRGILGGRRFKMAEILMKMTGIELRPRVKMSYEGTSAMMIRGMIKTRRRR